MKRSMICLGVAIAVLVGWKSVYATKTENSGLAIQFQPNGKALEMDRITGTFNQIPMGNLLENFRKEGYIQFKASEELLKLPVSAHFENERIPTALERLLEPFNYIMIDGPEGTVIIHLLGVKGDHSPNTVSSEPIKTESASVTLPVLDPDSNRMNKVDPEKTISKVSIDQRQAFQDRADRFKEKHSGGELPETMQISEQQRTFFEGGLNRINPFHPGARLPESIDHTNPNGNRFGKPR